MELHIIKRPGTLWRYWLGAFAFLASFLVRLALSPLLGSAVPYIFFFPGIVCSAWYGGLRSGLVTTGLSALASLYFLGARSAGLSTAATLSFLIFVCVGTFLSWLNDAFRQSQVRAVDELQARKQSEEALRISEERLTFALEAGGGVGAWDWDIPGDRVYSNPQFAALYSVTPENALAGIPLSQFLASIHPDDAESIGKSIRRAANTGGVFAEEYRILQQDGSVRWVHARGRCHLDAHGNPSRLPGVAFDITERKHADEALRETQDRLRAIYDGTFEYIGLLSPRGILLETNRSSLTFAGSTRAEVIGLPFWDTPWFADTPGAPEALREAVARAAAGEFVRYEAALCHPSGECPIFDLSLYPIRNERGEVVLIVPEGRDITDLKRAEDDLKRSNEELKRVNRELEEFAHVTSHDLQEPLRMVSIYTQLLLKRLGRENENLTLYAGFIREGVNRMEALLQDLLTFSRTIHTRETPVGTADLSAALADALSVLQPQIEESRAVIHFDLLPSVSGDTSQLTHVFQNLLSNALKYRNEAIRPEIHISATLVDDRWTVSVRDNGIGFEQRYAAQIFGLFKRLHKTEYPGTGLGLAICERIVERYRGRIWAEGQPGEGATFFFSLPPAAA